MLTLAPLEMRTTNKPWPHHSVWWTGLEISAMATRQSVRAFRKPVSHQIGVVKGQKSMYKGYAP